MKANSGSEVAEKAANLPSPWPIPGANDLLDYWVDAWQRSILLLDVLRQRGNNSIEHNARKAPNVLSFDAELVLDGRSLPRPVNYGLVRIVPPQGHRDRPEQAAVHRLRPARRAWPRHRRHEARQRDRGRARRRPSLLFRRLSAGPGARSDDRGCVRSGGPFCRGGRQASPERRGQALSDRQLPGRLADHDDEPPSTRNRSARSCSPDRRSPIGPACTARTRCAISAGCWAGPG